MAAAAELGGDPELEGAEAELGRILLEKGAREILAEVYAA